ncbi:MAG: MgtC/SapB family protein [Thermotaleaceae bacterium]
MTMQIVFFKLFLAALLGAIIGHERESTLRSTGVAGIRTHTLVCIGACLVMLNGVFIFEMYHQLSTMDPTRLAAQVISGIGFLGAGQIIKEGNTVKGLTTAASLWAVAAIGIAVASGFYSGALMTTAIIFVVLKTVSIRYKSCEKEKA